MTNEHLHEPHAHDLASRSTDSAIATRMSVRAFTRQPVAREVLSRLLESAALDGSPAAAVPWRVHVLQGHSRNSLCDKVCATHDAMRADPGLLAQYPEQYDYYPGKWTSPYLERRRENGWGLYGLLGIGRADKDKMHAQHQRNYRFFDAPIGLVFTMNRAFGGESLLRCGRFMQSVMLHARRRGLHTCPQAAWGPFAQIVLPHVGAADDDMLVGAMSLGHADSGAPVNTYHTPRRPVAEFCRWLD